VLTVVGPGDPIEISMPGAQLSEGTASVHRLGCVNRSRAATFVLRPRKTTWAASLGPGAYQLDLFARFSSDDGRRSGDQAATLGLLVDPGGRPEIVPASEHFVCAPRRWSRSVTGGSPRQRAVLRQIVDRLGDPPALEMALTPVPAGFRPEDGVSVRIRVPQLGPRDMAFPTWAGLVAAGALRDASREERLPEVATYTLGPPRGETAAIDGAIPAPTNATREQIEQRIASAAAEESGVTLRSVVVYEPHGLVPVVTVTVADPQTFLAQGYGPLQRSLDVLVEGRAPAAGGFFLDARDPVGVPFLEAGVSTATGSGVRWVRADLVPFDRTTTSSAGGETQP
jgi:hypothetical protein